MPILTKKKKLPEKQQTAQDFVNVEDVKGDILYGRNGYLFAYLQVRADNSDLLSATEQRARVNTLTQALSGEKESWQLLSIPRTVDISGMMEHLSILRKQSTEQAKLHLLTGEMNALRDMAEEGTKEPVIIVKTWIKAARGADKVLRKRNKDLLSRLQSSHVTATLLEDVQIVYICRLFADLAYYQDKDEIWESEDIPILAEEPRKLTKKNENTDQQALLNAITPVGGIQFGVSKITVGSVVGRIYGATRFPAEVDFNWLTAVMNATDCITAITYRPGNAAEMGDAISNGIGRSTKDAITESDTRRRLHYEREVTDGEKLIEQMDTMNEPIGHVSCLVMPYTAKEQELDDVCRQVIGRFKGIKLRALGNLQKEAYKHISPYYPPQSLIDKMLLRIMPLRTLMGGSPMTIHIFRDDRGYYFARTKDGGIISLDMQYRGGTRTNGNIVCSGTSGSGKSTALKHIIMSLYMAGTKVIIIDPEREFKDLCRVLAGTWLDCNGGAAIINPLQVRPIPPDDEDDENLLFRSKDNALALHLTTLEVFFKLYRPSLTDIQMATLTATLTELYANKNIMWDTDVTQLKNTAYPIMEDLVQLLEKKKQKEDDRYAQLAILLHDAAYGAHARLWNGYTNVDMDTQVICFDTNTLLNGSAENILQAQYFNVMTLAWERMSANRSEPVILACDEAHLMLNPKIPEPGMYLRNISKRCRKREGMLATVFQSLSDALHDDVKLYGQAILDNAVYKLLFRCEGKNLKDTAALFDLTEAEQDLLLAATQGNALWMCGSQRMQIEFDIPQYKLDLMGKGGGR